MSVAWQTPKAHLEPTYMLANLPFSTLQVLARAMSSAAWDDFRVDKEYALSMGNYGTNSYYVSPEISFIGDITK